MRSTAFHRPTALDRVLPGARLTEVQSVELALPIDEAWEATRHLDLSRSRLVAALFTARTLPARLLRRGEEPSAAVTLGIDDLGSTPDEPGFQILVDEPPSEVVVGAIGQVWQLDIPFVHVPDADAFADYEEPDQVKVAWALQVDALDAESARVSVEVRVDATTDEAWDRFRRYFRRIGPGSRIVRRTHAAPAGSGPRHPRGASADPAPPRRRLPGRCRRRADPLGHDPGPARRGLAVAGPDGQSAGRLLQPRPLRQRRSAQCPRAAPGVAGAARRRRDPGDPDGQRRLRGPRPRGAPLAGAGQPLRCSRANDSCASRPRGPTGTGR